MLSIKSVCVESIILAAGYAMQGVSADSFFVFF